MKQTKTNKISNWILGVVMCLLGVVLMRGSAGGGTLALIGGLISLPPVKNRIPDFKHKKGVITLVSIVLFCVGAGIYITDNDREIASALRDEIIREEEGKGAKNSDSLEESPKNQK